MHYFDGQDVRLGDVVDLGGGMTGIVRAIPLDDAFDEKFPAGDWSNLETGLLVESKEAGLVHYPEETSARLGLLSRRAPR